MLKLIGANHYKLHNLIVGKQQQYFNEKEWKKNRKTLEERIATGKLSHHRQAQKHYSKLPAIKSTNPTLNTTQETKTS